MSNIDIIVKLMVEIINFDARYLIIRFWDFSLDFTEGHIYIYIYIQIIIDKI